MRSMIFCIAALALGVQAKLSYAPHEPMCQCFDLHDMGDGDSTKYACPKMHGTFYNVTDSKNPKWFAPGVSKTMECKKKKGGGRAPACS